MRNIFTCLILVLLFYVCSAKDSKFRAIVTPVPPIVVYDQKDLQQLDLHIDFENLESIGDVSLLDIPILNRDSNFIDRPLQRAIAVGYPYKCGASSRAWNRKRYEEAVKAVLSGSMNTSKGRELHVNHKCGSRLILVNNNLLVDPKELPKSFFVTYIMKFKSVTGKSGYSHGMFEYSGRGENLPVKLYDSGGETICEGEYSLSLFQAVFNAGSFRMQCFEEKVELKGTLMIDKINLKHKKGKMRIAIGHGLFPNGSSINFITGISVKHLKHYKQLLD